MTTGWKIVTVLPNPSGASPLQEWSLVAIPDKGEAIRAIKARHPHAAIRVDSEADAELLAKYDVRDGKIFVLPLEDCIRIRTGERGKEAI